MKPLKKSQQLRLERCWVEVFKVYETLKGLFGIEVVGDIQVLGLRVSPRGLGFRVLGSEGPNN